MNKFFLLLFACTSVFGDQQWFTGPLLVPNAEVIPKGQTQWQPYVFQFWNDGIYNQNWNKIDNVTLRSTNIQACIIHGIAKSFDLEILPQMYINSRSGETSTRFGDFTLFIGYQALKESRYIPALRWTIQETFPSGQYDKLSSYGTAASGGGSYQTGTSLNFLKRFKIDDLHTFNLYWSLSYTIPSPVTLKGRNVYGGDPTTRGKVYPGNIFQLINSFEFNLTRHFAIACDIVNLWRDHGRFSGRTIQSSKRQSSYQLSFAPALEYNFSKNLGIIAGSWLTATGRSAAAFKSVVVAINYVH